MISRFRPLPCKDVRNILKTLGFEPDKQKSTNHEHWRIIRDGKLFKVTVDCHKGEVKALDVRSIIKQAGVSKSTFFGAL